MKNSIIFFLFIFLFTSCAPAATIAPVTSTPLATATQPLPTFTLLPPTPKPTNTQPPTITPLPDIILQDIIYTKLLPYDFIVKSFGEIYDEEEVQLYKKLLKANVYYYLQVDIPAGDRVWVIACSLYICSTIANRPNTSEIKEAVARLVWTDGHRGTIFVPSVEYIRDAEGDSYEIALSALSFWDSSNHYIDLAKDTVGASNILDCRNIDGEIRFCGEEGTHYFLTPVQPTELIPEITLTGN